jgi:hypothetical protein
MARALTPRGGLYRRPDADQWLRDRGVRPHWVDAGRKAVWQAHALCFEDRTTLDGEAAAAIHDQLHMLCDSIRLAALEPEESLCFFDETEGGFYIYPAGNPAP